MRRRRVDVRLELGLQRLRSQNTELLYGSARLRRGGVSRHQGAVGLDRPFRVVQPVGDDPCLRVRGPGRVACGRETVDDGPVACQGESRVAERGKLDLGGKKASLGPPLVIFLLAGICLQLDQSLQAAGLLKRPRGERGGGGFGTDLGEGFLGLLERVEMLVVDLAEPVVRFGGEIRAREIPDYVTIDRNGDFDRIHAHVTGRPAQNHRRPLPDHRHRWEQFVVKVARLLAALDPGIAIGQRQGNVVAHLPLHPLAENLLVRFRRRGPFLAPVKQVGAAYGCLVRPPARLGVRSDPFVESERRIVIVERQADVAGKEQGIHVQIVPRVSLEKTLRMELGLGVIALHVI